jgi:hypothetical protein
MTTKTKSPETFTIPEEHQEEIRDLCDAETEAEIRTECARNRMNIAKKAGDAEMAVAEKRLGHSLQRQYKAAHDRLWERIHEVMPELDRDGHWSIDIDDMEISESRGGRGDLSGLARMFAGRDDD